MVVSNIPEVGSEKGREKFCAQKTVSNCRIILRVTWRESFMINLHRESQLEN